MTETAQHIGSDVVAEQYVTDFRENGFTRVPNVLTEDEVTWFRSAALAEIDRAGAVAGGGLRVGRTAVMTTTDAWWRHEDLRLLARHPRIGAIVERLAGMSMRVWGGEAFTKSPGDDIPTLWHDDLTFAPLDSRLVVNAWIALVDVPAERGCMTFLPGSHRRDDPYRGELDAARADPDSYLFTQWPQLRWNRRVTVPLRAGDATFHQWRTGHTAAGNTSDSDRVAFITTYTDAAATYRPHPGHHDLDLTPGQLPPDDRFPRVADLG